MPAWAGNLASARIDAVRLPAQLVGRNDNAVTSSGTPTFIENAIMDLAIDISK
jgi:hypothetical protein